MADESDYLDQDPRIRTQQFVCVSIVTPSDVDVRTREYMAARSFAIENKLFSDNEKYDGAYKDYLATRQSELDDEFKDCSKNKPHIPILKIRGSYKTEKEARQRCAYLAKLNRLCDISVAPVGSWVPADGKRRDTETEICYAEKEMQKIMKRKTEQLDDARSMFDRRIQTDIDKPRTGGDSDRRAKSPASQPNGADQGATKEVDETTVTVPAAPDLRVRPSTSRGLKDAGASSSVSPLETVAVDDPVAAKAEPPVEQTPLSLTSKVMPTNNVQDLARNLYDLMKKSAPASSNKPGRKLSMSIDL